MKTIFEEYGGAIITVIAIVLFIAIIAILLNGDGPVADNFQSLISNFFNKANSAAGGSMSGTGH